MNEEGYELRGQPPSPTQKYPPGSPKRLSVSGEGKAAPAKRLHLEFPLEDDLHEPLGSSVYDHEDEVPDDMTGSFHSACSFDDEPRGSRYTEISSFDLTRDQAGFHLCIGQEVPTLLNSSQVSCTMQDPKGRTVTESLVKVEEIGRGFNNTYGHQRDAILTGLKSWDRVYLTPELKEKCQQWKFITTDAESRPTDAYKLLDAFDGLSLMGAVGIYKWGKVDWKTDGKGSIIGAMLHPPAVPCRRRLTPLVLDTHSGFSFGEDGEEFHT